MTGWVQFLAEMAVIVWFVAAGIVFVLFVAVAAWVNLVEAVDRYAVRRSARVAASFAGLGVPVTVAPRVRRLDAILAPPIPAQRTGAQR